MNPNDDQAAHGAPHPLPAELPQTAPEAQPEPQAAAQAAPEAAPATEAVQAPAPETAPAQDVVPGGEGMASPEAAPAAAPSGRAARETGAGEMSVKACAAQLRERFPALFGGRPKPLKLRIQQDINQRCPGVFPKQTLSAFLRRHTMTDAYLQAVSTQAQRFDLDGQPAGELSEEHRKLAAETLQQRRAREDEKHAAERAAEAERVQRATLLAAFETTTLTRENFCALKGVDAAGLDALLAQAREERRQRQQFLAELLEAFRASGQNVPAFAASRRMHPAQLDRLLREASGGGQGPGGPGRPRSEPRREGSRREGGERHEAGGRRDDRGPRGARPPRGEDRGPSPARQGKGSGRPPRG